MFNSDSRADCARANFIFALLELAATYCFLAEQSDLQLRSNHLRNALRTHENAIRFVSRADLRNQQLSDITSDLEQLKVRLEALRQLSTSGELADSPAQLVDKSLQTRGVIPDKFLGLATRRGRT